MSGLAGLVLFGLVIGPRPVPFLQSWRSTSRR